MWGEEGRASVIGGRWVDERMRVDEENCKDDRWQFFELFKNVKKNDTEG